MAANNATNQELAGETEINITFKCRFCEEQKPYSDMVVMTDFFPPLTACRECAQYLSLKKERVEVREEQ